MLPVSWDCFRIREEMFSFMEPGAGLELLILPLDFLSAQWEAGLCHMPGSWLLFFL